MSWRSWNPEAFPRSGLQPGCLFSYKITKVWSVGKRDALKEFNNHIFRANLQFYEEWGGKVGLS
jgi:hypothetical protein